MDELAPPHSQPLGVPGGDAILVLVRYAEQGFWVGGVHVKVLGINGGRVKLGIEGPLSIEVLRDELRSNDDAARLASGTSANRR